MPNNKYIFHGTLSFNTALHIGGGNINETNTDMPIMKTPDGRPFIPGSSIKGVFRSLVERVAIRIPGVKTCQLNSEAENCASSERLKWKVKNEDGSAKKENQIVDELEGKVDKVTGLCDTCKLFGSPHRASKVFFRDLNITEWAEMTQLRDGVVINRDSGTAEGGLKYDYEVLPTDSQFEFEISAENLNPTDLGLLSIGLNELVSGDFQVGGKTTRGLGNCKLIDMVIYISDWENPDQFKKFILGNTRETKYAVKSQADAKLFLLEKINHLF